MIKTILLSLLGYQFYPACEVSQVGNTKFQGEITNVWLKVSKKEVKIKSKDLTVTMKVESSYDNAIFFGHAKNKEACSLVYCSDKLVFLTINKSDTLIYQYSFRND